MKRFRITMLTTAFCAAMISRPAFADTDAATAQQIQAMQAQIQALQAQLQSMQTQVAATNQAVQQQASAASSSTGGLQNKNIKLTVGGFIEAAGIERSRGEAADLASSWSGIPLNNSTNGSMSEFRESSRQSRLSLLAQGSPDANTDLAAYFEGDFLGAAPTANSAESNSYTPRLRQAYATYDRSDLGFHFLGGQAWSLITMDKQGIIPRQENVPQTIDAGYVPGFTWTRNTQMRFVEDFDNHKIWAGISFESPQANIASSVGTPASGAPIVTAGGGSGYASTVNYSLDAAPDVIAKVAFDPGWGHYEVYGVGRVFRDQPSLGGGTDTIYGGGIGAGAILPIIDKKLEFQVSGLAGRGVGRYGSVQLPDVTTTANGTLAAVTTVEVLAGLTAHPNEHWDLYLYSGFEETQKTYSDSGSNHFGYGNPQYDNSQCSVEGASSTHCVGNTRAVGQITGGAWWKFYKGSYGMMEAGLQDSYSKRYVFDGIGGGPTANENITMVSFRYYPF